MKGHTSVLVLIPSSHEAIVLPTQHNRSKILENFEHPIFPQNISYIVVNTLKRMNISNTNRMAYAKSHPQK